jgi:hypothetical protein
MSDIFLELFQLSKFMFIRSISFVTLKSLQMRIAEFEQIVKHLLIIQKASGMCRNFRVLILPSFLLQFLPNSCENSPLLSEITIVRAETWLLDFITKIGLSLPFLSETILPRPES